MTQLDVDLLRVEVDTRQFHLAVDWDVMVLEERLEQRLEAVLRKVEELCGREAAECGSQGRIRLEWSRNACNPQLSDRIASTGEPGYRQGPN